MTGLSRLGGGDVTGPCDRLVPPCLAGRRLCGDPELAAAHFTCRVLAAFLDLRLGHRVGGGRLGVLSRRAVTLRAAVESLRGLLESGDLLDHLLAQMGRRVRLGRSRRRLGLRDDDEGTGRVGERRSRLAGPLDRTGQLLELTAQLGQLGLVRRGLELLLPPVAADEPELVVLRGRLPFAALEPGEMGPELADPVGGCLGTDLSQRSADLAGPDTGELLGGHRPAIRTRCGSVKLPDRTVVCATSRPGGSSSSTRKYWRPWSAVVTRPRPRLVTSFGVVISPGRSLGWTSLRASSASAGVSFGSDAGRPVAVSPPAAGVLAVRGALALRWRAPTWRRCRPVSVRRRTIAGGVLGRPSSSASRWISYDARPVSASRGARSAARSAASRRTAVSVVSWLVSSTLRSTVRASSWTSSDTSGRSSNWSSPTSLRRRRRTATAVVDLRAQCGNRFHQEPLVGDVLAPGHRSQPRVQPVHRRVLQQLAGTAEPDPAVVERDSLRRHHAERDPQCGTRPLGRREPQPTARRDPRCFGHRCSVPLRITSL